MAISGLLTHIFRSGTSFIWPIEQSFDHLSPMGWLEAMDQFILTLMRMRGFSRRRKRHVSSRHHNFRELVSRLTVGFVIGCFTWMVVMLAVYEWHAIHSISK